MTWIDKLKLKLADWLRRKAFSIAQSVKAERTYAPGMDPRLKGTDKYWANLWANNADQSEYSSYVWAVRNQWLNELYSLHQQSAEKKLTCTQCSIRALQEKFENVLRAHVGYKTLPTAEEIMSGKADI